MSISKTSYATRRQVLWAVTGAIAGTSLNGCMSYFSSSTSRSANRSSTRAVSLGATAWIGLTPLYIAQAKGFFQAAGLNLETKFFNTVAQAFPAFTSGQIDAIIPVISEAIILAARGVDFRIVAVMDTSTGADVMIARNSIRSIQDFKGKKIAVELGGIGHYFVLQVLAEAGLSARDVTLVNTPPDAAAAAFQTGNVEIIYSYSPFSDRVLDMQKDGRIVYSSRQLPMAIADIYAVQTKFLQSHPNAVFALLQGHFKGLDFLQTNSSEGLEIAAKALNISPTDLKVQLQGLQFPDLELSLELLANSNSSLYLLKSITRLAEFLQAQGQISAIPDLSKLLEPQFVKALKE